LKLQPRKRVQRVKAAAQHALCHEVLERRQAGGSTAVQDHLPGIPREARSEPFYRVVGHCEENGARAVGRLLGRVAESHPFRGFPTPQGGADQCRRISGPLCPTRVDGRKPIAVLHKGHGEVSAERTESYDGHRLDRSNLPPIRQCLTKW